MFTVTTEGGTARERKRKALECYSVSINLEVRGVMQDVEASVNVWVRLRVRGYC